MKTKVSVVLAILFVVAGVHTTFAQKKIALVTFYCDKKIGGTGLGTAIESLVNDPSFDLQGLVDKSYQRFVNDFAKDFPFQLLDHQTVVGNAQYQSYRSRYLMDTSKTINKLAGIQYAVADKFIFAFSEISSVAKEENRDQCNLVKIFDTADGTLFVSMDYEFESRLMGLGAGITAYLNMFLYDKKCDRVFTIREWGKSKSKVAAVGGIPVMDPKKIQPLCEDATDVLFEELKGKLDKIVKKSAKKLGS